MPATIEPELSSDLVDTLLRLPKDAKDDLAFLLIDSMKRCYSSVAEAEQMDQDELKRRIASVQAGTVPLIPAAEAVLIARRRLEEFVRNQDSHQT